MTTTLALLAAIALGQAEHQMSFGASASDEDVYNAIVASYSPTSPDIDLVVPTPPQEEDVVKKIPGGDRIIVVIGCGTPECKEFQRKLYELVGEASDIGWRFGETQRDAVQILDIRKPDHLETVESYFGMDGDWELPLQVMIEDGEIVREIKTGCGTPLSTWSLYWLHHGERHADDPALVETVTVPTSGGYPVRGGWWSVSGSHNVSTETLRNHLSTAPEHAGDFDSAWLATLTWEELNSLHSDDNERRVKSAYVNRMGYETRPASAQATVEKKVATVNVSTYSAPVRYPYWNTYAGNCPHCPNYRSYDD